MILGLLLLVIVFVAFRAFTGGPFKMSADQISAGSAYMKSLKKADLQPWIDRTKKFLSEYDPKSQSIGVYGIEGKPIPPDLQQLKIIRIDISPNQVRYVWIGGVGPRIDLEVDRLPDGSFTLTAHYSDTDSEVIWPRTPNQSMKPAAHSEMSSACLPPDEDDDPMPEEEKPRYLLPGGAKDLGDVLLPKSVSVPDPISVGDLATALRIKPFILVAALMDLNIFASLRTALDFDTVSAFCSRHGVIARKII